MPRLLSFKHGVRMARASMALQPRGPALDDRPGEKECDRENLRGSEKEGSLHSRARSTGHLRRPRSRVGVSGSPSGSEQKRWAHAGGEGQSPCGSPSPVTRWTSPEAFRALLQVPDFRTRSHKHLMQHVEATGGKTARSLTTSVAAPWFSGSVLLGRRGGDRPSGGANGLRRVRRGARSGADSSSVDSCGRGPAGDR